MKEETALQTGSMSELLKQLSGAAHDLNNALSVVRGYPDLLINNHIEPQRALYFLEQIKYAANRAAETTNLLLALGRTGRSEREVITLERLLKVAADNYRVVISADLPELCFQSAETARDLSLSINVSLFSQLIMLLNQDYTTKQDARPEITVSRSESDELLFRWPVPAASLSSGTPEAAGFAAYVRGMIVASLQGRLDKDADGSILLYLPLK